MGVLDQKVAEISTKLNTLLEKAKKTDQFTHQTALNAYSKIRVYVNGVSEYITLQQVIDSALLSNYNFGINGIVSGTIEYIGGLSHRTLNLVYRFNNVLYYSNGFPLTSAVNTSGLPRIDVFYGDVDLDGSLFILEGDPGGTKPVLEWGHQLELTFVTIQSGATVPDGISNILWYNENLQELGGEKDTSTPNPTFVTLDSPEQVSLGTKAIKIVNRNHVDLNSTVKYLGSNLSNVLLKVYCQDSTNNSLRLQLWVNGTMRVGEIYVTHGTFNFDAFLVGQWQTIVVPGSAFRVGGAWGNEEYDYMYVGNNKSGTTIFVDDIRIQQGTTATAIPSSHTHTNLSVLESITAPFISAWNTASDWITTNGQNILNFIANANKKPIVSAIWKELLKFDVKATQFPAGDNWYEATPNEVTLVAADDLLDRIDLIGAFAPIYPATLGLVGKITGNPASTELVVPPDYDPETFFPIKQVIVKAGSTTPTDGNGNTMSTVTAYANGTGEPDEFTFSSNNASIVNAAGVINATNPSSSHVATLMNNADVAGLDSLKEFSLSFDLTLKANLGSSYMFVKLLGANGVQMISPLLFRNGKFGLNSSSLATQNIVITGDYFSFITLGSFRGIQIYPFKSFAGYTLDNIKFHVGSAVIPVPSSHTHRDFNFLESLTQAMFDAKEDKANKQNSLTVDGTGEKYPTVDAVNAGLATKLDASAYNQHFKGKFLTAAAMRAAFPTANIGDSAQVNEVGATTVVNYSWDDELVDWVITGSVSGGAANTDELPEGSTNLYFTVARWLANLTKANIEEKLIGEITSHTHPASGGSSNINAGAFNGVIDVSQGNNVFYDDYIAGATVNLSLSVTKVLGSVATVRIKGDLMGTIPVDWEMSGQMISSLATQMNELTLLFVNENDVRLVNRISNYNDTEAPSTPLNLVASNTTDTTISLAWDVSTDNIAVASYKVRQGGIVVATPTTNSATITGLTAETAYSFTVSALDASGNESGQSIALNVTTIATPVGFETEYQNWLDYGAANSFDLPSVSQQTIDNTKIKNLKTENLWNEIPILHFAKATYSPSTFAKNIYRVNIKTPGVHTLISDAGKEPSFISGQGWKSNGLQFFKYITPSTDLTMLSKTNTSLFFSVFDVPETYDTPRFFLGGRLNSTENTHLLIGNNLSGKVLGRLFEYINTAQLEITVPQNQINGHYQILSGTNIGAYKDGINTNFSYTNETTSPLTATQIHIFGFNTNGTHTDTSAFGIKYIGWGTLMAGKELILSQIMNETYTG